MDCRQPPAGQLGQVVRLRVTVPLVVDRADQDDAVALVGVEVLVEEGQVVEVGEEDGRGRVM
jgi:hypothetical protein